MSKKLFIGNLSWNIDDEQLRELFEEYGEVEDSFVMKDRETRRSRGFGFVTFVDDASADTAIEALNGKEVDGREISVDVAKPKTNRF